MAQRALPPEGPSLVFPKKAWHTQGDHHGCLYRHTLSGARHLSARQTQRPGKYISVFERLCCLTSPKMSFLDVSATQGSWAATWSKSVVHNQGDITSQGTAGCLWTLLVSLTEGKRAVLLAFSFWMPRMVPNTQQHTTAQLHNKEWRFWRTERGRAKGNRVCHGNPLVPAHNLF